MMEGEWGDGGTNAQEGKANGGKPGPKGWARRSSFNNKSTVRTVQVSLSKGISGAAAENSPNIMRPVT